MITHWTYDLKWTHWQKLNKIYETFGKIIFRMNGDTYTGNTWHEIEDMNNIEGNQVRSVFEIV